MDLNIIIKEEVEKLNEFIGNDMISLSNYFSMSDDEKIMSLPYEFVYEFNTFKNETNLDIEIDPDSDEQEEYQSLLSNDRDLFRKFGLWLYNKIISHELNAHAADYPAWSYFGQPKLVKNQWLIHFTDHADEVAKDGFTRGVDDMTKLGLTTCLSDFDKEYGGYDFSFLLTDFQKYGSESRSGGDRNEYKYGAEAVIFRASGIKLYHYGDEEPQVIFYGNTARNITPILFGDEKKWKISSTRTGNTLYEADDMEEIVRWFTINYAQYRKHLG